MKTLVTGFGLALLAGCAPQTTPTPLPVEIPHTFSASGDREIPERWWTAFGDPELNSLVEQAMNSNFNLETAWQRLREARAIVERESSALFPVLDAQAQGEIRSSDSDPDSNPNEQLLLGVVSEYEVDLWGRIRSGAEAEKYRARATLDDYRTAVLSLSAEVARAWFHLITAGDQLGLIEAQIETNEKVLELIEARFRSGLVRRGDVLRQRQLVEATREQKISAESRIQVLEHLLAVLLGRPPQEETAFPDRELPELPPLPRTGLPLELVCRRPDVRRAFHLLQAADRELATAISNRYPRLTLSASATTTNDSGEELFDDWVTTIGGNLLAPIFDAGRRKAEVNRADAVRSQRRYTYAQTTLTAFQEVEDALIRERKQVERIDSLQEQAVLAGQAYQQLRVEYFNGAGNYIDALTALAEEQQLRRDLLDARRDLLEFRIALYRALAGGFETEREIGHDPSS